MRAYPWDASPTSNAGESLHISNLRSKYIESPQGDISTKLPSIYAYAFDMCLCTRYALRARYASFGGKINKGSLGVCFPILGTPVPHRMQAQACIYRICEANISYRRKAIYRQECYRYTLRVRYVLTHSICASRSMCLLRRQGEPLACADPNEESFPSRKNASSSCLTAIQMI